MIRILLMTLLLLAQFGTAVVAHAAAPPTQPTVIRTEGFESALSSDWTLRLYGTGGTAYWGRMSQIAHVGSSSLWCSGSVPTKWSLYASGTRGIATLDLPQLEQYYSSQVDLYYSMPSLGANDGNSFSLLWQEDGSTSYDPILGLPLTGAGSWSLLDRELTAVSNEVNLSRTPGSVSLRFLDSTEGPLQSPTTGQGASVDDLVIKGFKYGPVRNLTVMQVGDALHVDWTAPARSTTSATSEDRAVTYRLWRALDGGSPTWVELTSTGARLTASEYLDASADPGTTYQYAVQAWDTAGGPGYGELAESAAGRLLRLGMDVASFAPAEVRSGGQIEIDYEVTNTGEAALSSIQVTDNWGSVSTIGSLDPGQTVTVSRTRTIATTTEISVTATAGGGSPSATDERTVTAVHPAVSLQVIPAATSVLKGADVGITYRVENTGDVPLTGLVITDGLGALVGSLGTLGVGEVHEAVRQTVLNASGVVTGMVDAAFVVAGEVDHVSGTAISPYITAEDPPSMPDRIAGASRILTAVEISKQAFPDGLTGDKAVVIASGYSWADALPASALAGAVRGPLLLTQQSEVPADVMSEISRLNAAKVYVIGGSAVVSDGVVDQLARAGLSVVRLAGPTRYGTAREVAGEVQSLLGHRSTVFVATGANFPDALAASSMAAALGAPILLTRVDAIPSDTHTALASLAPDLVVVCGGTGVVSESTAQALGSSAYGYPEVVRKSGANRYQTAYEVVLYGEELTGNSTPDGVFVSTGANYPDALAGGALAGIGGSEWRPLLLTESQGLSDTVASYISTRPSILFASVLGGEGAVSDAIDSEIRALLE